ncbi:MAG TPA: tetratricopeptide repeat protein, partial [Burkholderiaceae bacterium]|nr:tetratricopeptide repeat protein [Burkholderiaceae bacterium]
LDPGRYDALNNLGILLGRRGKLDDAEKVLAKVVELAPGYADARQNLANLYLRTGRVGDAVQQCIDGLIDSPRDPMLRRVLGMAYTSLGRRDEAIAVWRAWLDVEPDNPLPRFHLHACTGEGVPERAGDVYVEQTFDRFAESFESVLNERLQYQAPQLCAGLLARLLPPPARQFVMLDAGCGTGLCGPLMAPWARVLAGVDLSRGMLDRAQTKGVYQDLYKAELTEFLTLSPDQWEVIVSADTLCYFGDLSRVLAAAAGSLKAGGTLVFTVEALPDAVGLPLQIQPHGRYAHHAGHLDAALSAAGLQTLACEPVLLRNEGGQPVQGWLVGARRPAD